MTNCNEAIRPVHNRMPVLLMPGDYDRWLNGSAEDAMVLKERCFPDELIEITRTDELWFKRKVAPTDRRSCFDGLTRRAAAIANAILEASRQPDDTVVVHSRDVQQALATVLAMLLEAEPHLDTPATLHEACSLLAAERLIQAEAMRQKFELTRRHPWDAQSIVIN